MGAGVYKIKKILGSGATAVVCVAEPQGRPTEVVALKVLHQDLLKDLSALNRMRDEARMLSGLHHPHILGVNQLLDYDGRPVIEMEYVKGVALDTLMRKFANGLPGGVALSIGTKIAVALDAAYYSTHGPHDDPMHIIHRDLKPSNVLLSTSGAVKVVDFGMAKARFEGRQSKTLVGVVGTREFMPPEVLLGEAYTSAVDVYSLAMTLFNLLTGKMIVLPRRQEAHDQAVARSLPHLNPAALPDIVVGRLREQLANMLRYSPEERPELCDVAGSLQMLVMHPDVDLDLGGFAAREVLPLFKSRGEGPPRDHQKFQDILFLESVAPSEAPVLTVAEAEKRVRELLSTPEWPETSVADLHRTLQSANGLVSKPLIEILERSSPAWWQKMWVKQASNEELAAALVLLSDRPDAAALSHAKRLASHESSRVANAAQFLLKENGEL